MPVWNPIALKPRQLTLKHVLKSGQSFRWQVTPLPPTISPPHASEEYSLCLPDRLVLLRQSATSIHYATVYPDDFKREPPEETDSTLAWLRDYFQLDVDLETLYRAWGERDDVFRRKFGSVDDGGDGLLEGVRVLRQDPWECCG